MQFTLPAMVLPAHAIRSPATRTFRLLAEPGIALNLLGTIWWLGR